MDQLDEIRSKIDLVQFISEYLPLQKAGRNFKTLCPFHSEKTPSFIVSPERQIWKCFGCGAGGDAFRFLMEYERMDFGEALRFLAKRTGVVLKSYRPTEDEAKKGKLYEINHLAAEFFHFLLLNHPAAKKALNYILERGITKDSLRFFKIGYSPDLWDSLQKYLVGKKGFGLEELEKAGLVIPRQGATPAADRRPPATFYDRFRNRLIFPLCDHRGNICGFAGRVLDPEVKEAKYVNTPETLVYHKSDLLYPLEITKEEIKKANQAVVVEGELDAISSFQVGIKNVVAIKGSALTENQARLLKRFAENLVLALDTDIAGDNAARRGIEIADKEGLNIRVIELGKYKDPDEAAQKDPKFYREKLKQAIPFYEYLIDSALKRHGLETPEGKRKISDEIVPTLAKIENESIKDHYVRMLSGKLGVSEEAILNQIKKASLGISTTKPTAGLTKPVRPRRDLLEEYLLALYFQGKKTDLLIEKDPFYFRLPAHRRIIELLKEFLKDKKRGFKSEEFFPTLPGELREIFNNFYLVDFGSKIDDTSWVDSEIAKAEKELETIKIKEDLANIAEQIRKLETEGKEGSDDWQKAQEEFRRLSAELAWITEEKRI
jgi:DNA primase